MCGISGIINLRKQKIPDLNDRLVVMNQIQRHRGPDGHGTWTHAQNIIGLGHQRLSIIDLSTGAQPMKDSIGNWIAFNGEIYNYIELRDELGGDKAFKTHSDTEVILKAYQKWGQDCLDHLRGMFAFALWDESQKSLFCARDRFGIKPFYYTTQGDFLYFSSEIKTLLPFMDAIETDLEGFQDYLTFQFCLAGKTLFKNVHELRPGHCMMISGTEIRQRQYWEVYYHQDFDHRAEYFEEKIRELLEDSVRIHMRSDVPVGAYISGGLDSGVVASIASREDPSAFCGFTGKFTYDASYDESHYAQALADWRGFELKQIDINSQDFVDNIRKVIYHLDFPVAGPGSFPQYMVSKLASQHRKVVLGGQGGDEIFGGYTRYLVAYFEQCIRGAIDGSLHNGNYIVTYESIIPNLTALKNYKPMLREFWSKGLFEAMDKRYFHLINRAPMLDEEIYWDGLNTGYSPFEAFQQIFGANNVRKESYFDSMTHFDFKTLLPALLQVEDRVSMAHGLESRVPLLDHPLIELAATIPSDIKFKDGAMKRVFKDSIAPLLPDVILDRKDKMGFPVPLTDWINSGELKEFVCDIFSSQKAQERSLINNKKVLGKIGQESKFGRKVWGLLCLELWQQEFHDKSHNWRDYLPLNSH